MHSWFRKPTPRSRPRRRCLLRVEGLEDRHTPSLAGLEAPVALEPVGNDPVADGWLGWVDEAVVIEVGDTFGDSAATLAVNADAPALEPELFDVEEIAFSIYSLDDGAATQPPAAGPSFALDGLVAALAELATLTADDASLVLPAPLQAAAVAPLPPLDPPGVAPPRWTSALFGVSAGEEGVGASVRAQWRGAEEAGQPAAGAAPMVAPAETPPPPPNAAPDAMAPKDAATATLLKDDAAATAIAGKADVGAGASGAGPRAAAAPAAALSPLRAAPSAAWLLGCVLLVAGCRPHRPAGRTPVAWVKSVRRTWMDGADGRSGVEAVDEAFAVDVELLEDVDDVVEIDVPVDGPDDDVQVFLAGFEAIDDAVEQEGVILEGTLEEAEVVLA